MAIIVLRHASMAPAVVDQDAVFLALLIYRLVSLSASKQVITLSLHNHASLISCRERLSPANACHNIFSTLSACIADLEVAKAEMEEVGRTARSTVSMY